MCGLLLAPRRLLATFQAGFPRVVELFAVRSEVLTVLKCPLRGCKIRLTGLPALLDSSQWIARMILAESIQLNASRVEEKETNMRTKVLMGSAVLALGLALAGCSGTSTSASSAPMASEMATTQAATQAATSAMATPAMSMLKGTFGGLNEKKVAGMASISDGMLTLSGFSSDEGPDLHVYLTNGTDEAAVSAGMELGKVVFNQASQSYTLASGVDASKYTDVVVHCDKAKAVFGAAPLS